MTVSGRSDFSHLAKFPEVYHGQGISKASFRVVRGRSQGRGETQHIASLSAVNTATSCVFGRCASAGLKQIRNYLFRISEVEKRNYCSMDTKNE